MLLVKWIWYSPLNEIVCLRSYFDSFLQESSSCEVETFCLPVKRAQEHTSSFPYFKSHQCYCSHSFTKTSISSQHCSSAIPTPCDHMVFGTVGCLRLSQAHGSRDIATVQQGHGHEDSHAAQVAAPRRALCLSATSLWPSQWHQLVHINTDESRDFHAACILHAVSMLNKCFQYPSTIHKVTQSLFFLEPAIFDASAESLILSQIIFCSFCTFHIRRLTLVHLNRLVTYKCSGNPCK